MIKNQNKSGFKYLLNEIKKSESKLLTKAVYFEQQKKVELYLMLFNRMAG